MSNVIPFDAYRAHGILEVRLEEFRRFVHMNRAGDTALAYHAARLEKAVDGLKKALFEFQGTLLLAQLETSVKQRQGENQ